MNQRRILFLLVRFHYGCRRRRIVALSSESSVALHRSDRDVFRCWCIRRTSPREGSADVPELWLTSPILYRRASALGPLRDCKFFERPLGRVFASGQCSPLPVGLFQQISSFLARPERIPLPSFTNKFHEGSFNFLGETLCFVRV